MMERTRLGKRRYGAALLMLVAGTAALELGLPTARADLPDPHVFLDYSTLDFVFTRNVTPATTGAVIGTFSIEDVAGSTLDAVLRDALAVELDRATILDDANFSVAVTGDVVFLGPDSYALVGSFVATDDSGTVKVHSDFNSSTVSMTGPPEFSNVLTIAGSLSTFGGGEGTILADGTSTSWSFAGHAGDTNALLDIGGDATISIIDRSIASYDTGALIDFSLGVTITDLDELFAASSVVAGGDMKVTIVPVPAAIVLGLIGFGTLAGVRRRLA